ncbi:MULTISPECIES: 4-hydroxy-tetrahydrodipicolinate reductase [Brevibacterium]|uniref:4-hydroxy-tetrahydrodipicolinate reductase n=1 Tax=Brevibacterium aurantiacum TaxID=273384 RepID=A0A2A3ZT04_BREAU|nr:MULTISPECIES: 4-hydroxy-tetrahydrodipicolinate reductase [Brevibacterium]MDN5551916.1 4-hydroxy-tetrahydrodipicolinate reductase [Brevibacterium sp.]MDN5737497.1 4-hydroxy-tetrahydrodipicolinate reductase [Brevibacterium aurantiacum]MDN5772578.1 4-hydroxy-tetrahydrodipicolinate reductase [Brevibacterium aurantiacum]PCC54678.1 4-hydroxy-tetrahydrodipicolinate reductase [Brevibacterium aurantiacum]WCE38886.1 4-hydroxy-tetrahydrodipicolinate reductase [Brevibacterium sp. BDJS002]
MNAIRVAVIGAQGRMGAQAVDAITEAEGLELVATLGSSDSLESLLEKSIDVAVELTVPASTEANVRFLVEHDIDTVVGTTGWDAEKLSGLEELLAKHAVTAVLIAPNFSIGAVLAMRFAELAAPYFDSAEVVEIHHPRKLDAPSGTANHTAQRIAAARNDAGLPPVPDATEIDPNGARGAVVDGIHVHAIRQQGMTASEEIHFGSSGEALTIRTDSHSTSAFMPGIVTAVRSISDYTGLLHGLENMLDL